MMHDDGGNGARSATEVAQADTLRMMSLNIDGLQGSLNSLLDWMDLNEVEVRAIQEAKLPASAIRRTKKAFEARGFEAF